MLFNLSLRVHRRAPVAWGFNADRPAQGQRRRAAQIDTVLATTMPTTVSTEIIRADGVERVRRQQRHHRHTRAALKAVDS